MKKIGCAIFLSTMICAAQAGGFYIGGQYGNAKLKDATSDLRGSRPADLTTTGSQDTTISLARFFAGYRLNDVVAFEFGYNQSGESNFWLRSTRPGYPVSTTRGSFKSSGYDATVLVSPFSSVQGLFFRAGVTDFTVKVDQTFYANDTVTGSSSNSKSGTGAVLGLGYDWKIGSGAIRLEANQLLSVAGINDNDVTTYSIGYLYQF